MVFRLGRGQIETHVGNSFSGIRSPYDVPGCLSEDTRQWPRAEWCSFFRIVIQKYADVIFLILGAYLEWDRELYSYSNVLIPAAMGFQLTE